jgi:AcrR family transcriptional regulator
MAAPGSKKEETRERIVRSAAALFDKNGFNATGVDAVVAAAGVAKMTLYQHFPSKDQLVLAAVRHLAEQQEAWIRGMAARTAVQRNLRPLEPFRDLETWVKAGTYAGSAVLKAAAEFPSPQHPIHAELGVLRQRLTVALADLLGECGYPDSVTKARRLKIVLDGAMAGAQGPDAVASLRDANALATMVIQR